MKLHEYQSKALFAEYGIPVPKGQVATTPQEAKSAAAALGGNLWVVKAQVHAGGRGKAGGVKLAKSVAEVEQYAKAMLGTRLPTRRAPRSQSTGFRPTSLTTNRSPPRSIGSGRSMYLSAAPEF